MSTMQSFFLVALLTIISSQHLEIKNEQFFLNNHRVFLSGVNQPWVQYGRDFGNNQTDKVFCQLNDTIAAVKKAGGNSIRIWLHTEGTSTPEFDSNGNVIGTDTQNTLISDMQLYLRTAAQQDVLIFFTLWNGAISIKSDLKGLIMDEAKLSTYITKVLQPMVRTLSVEQGLGGWEIINEPEGSVAVPVTDSNPCFDTTPLTNSGAGWTHSKIPMKNFQQFIAKQTAAIHAVNPKALVSVGTWSERSATDNFGYRAYWSDKCLVPLGGKTAALDWAQIHSYAYNNQYSQYSPFHLNKTAFGLNKPLVIGEFAAKHGGGLTVERLYDYAFAEKYDGAWDWSAKANDGNDVLADAVRGMEQLASKPDVKISILPSRGVPPRCGSGGNCSDVPPPPGTYTCEQQASWGKCGESWMKGYCCKSCFRCQGCK